MTELGKKSAWAVFLRKSCPSIGVFMGLAVGLWGWLMIFLVTWNTDAFQRFAGRQLVWIIFGSAVLLLSYNVPFSVYRRWGYWLAGAAYLSLLLVLVLGLRVNGMRGWFSFRWFNFQPSELAKPLFILFMAIFLESRLPFRDRWFKGFFLTLSVVGAWLLPLALQPDFGMILVFAFGFGILYWVHGVRLRYLASLGGVGIVGLCMLFWRHRYMPGRILAFIDPETHMSKGGWHILQFRRSLASGGWFGNSWDVGNWSSAYLPYSYSDSIFAGSAECMGFLGIFPLVFILFCWMIYIHYQACQSEDRVRSGVIFGLGAMLAGQAFLHLSVNLGILPPTGVTLPLVSYGGSSLVSCMFSIGLIESAIRENRASAGAGIAVEKQNESLLEGAQPDGACG